MGAKEIDPTHQRCLYAGRCLGSKERGLDLLISVGWGQSDRGTEMLADGGAAGQGVRRHLPYPRPRSSLLKENVSIVGE